MKTDERFWTFLPQLFLEWETSQTKFVDKVNTQFMFNKRYWQSCYSWDNVEKYGRAGHTTGDDMAHVHYKCWVPKATNTHSEYVIFIAFPL